MLKSNARVAAVSAYSSGYFCCLNVLLKCRIESRKLCGAGFFICHSKIFVAIWIIVIALIAIPFICTSDHGI